MITLEETLFDFICKASPFFILWEARAVNNQYSVMLNVALKFNFTGYITEMINVKEVHTTQVPGTCNTQPSRNDY